jgi:SAM-dependent MidA family methyltransferase
MDTGNPFILKELRRLIGKKGRIAFEEFMDMALYHPEYGYYTSERARIGRGGDFYTSSEVHRAFGICIMRQVEEMAGILQMRNAYPVNVVEVGAGKGLLCADILVSAMEKAPALFDSLRYFIVEKSPDFIERQKRHLGSVGAYGHTPLLDKVSWVPDIREAFSPSLSHRERVKGEGGMGIVLSNELIDAFPVHKVGYSNGSWSEIYVTVNDGELVEVAGELSSEALAAFLSALSPQPSAFEDGYTAEVNLKAMDWINEVGSILKKGFVITIDYGYPRRELYSPERNRGTLMCYYRHQASENPYMNIGEQDITAHVDFTSLAEAGEEAGLEVAGFTDQTHFLMGCGIEEEFRPVDGISRDTLDTFSSNITLKKLLMPGGMGGTFKVLIQHKGMERPKLRGFSFKDMTRRLRG